MFLASPLVSFAFFDLSTFRYTPPFPSPAQICEELHVCSSNETTVGTATRAANGGAADDSSTETAERTPIKWAGGRRARHRRRKRASL